jgi:renalase
MKRVAVIGAGLSGLVLARELDPKADVTVFEKARGVGGRMATRREAGFAFDHGARFFTARSGAFRKFLRPLLASGVVKPWQPRVLTFEAGRKPYKRDWFETHYVGCPGMSAVCRALAADLHIECGAPVADLQSVWGGWRMVLESGEVTDRFDWVISTLPAPQMQALMGTRFCSLAPEVQDNLQAVGFEPAYALMLGFDNQHRLGFGAARIKDPILDWISVNNSKPGRAPQQTAVVHSTGEWAASQLFADPAEVEAMMMAALHRVLPATLPEPAHVSLHRWRYAAVARALEFPGVLDTVARLGFCGDWCIGSHVEAAWTSAMYLAGQLLPLLCADRQMPCRNQG